MSPCRACGRPHEQDAAAPCPRTGTPTGQGPCGTRIDRYEVLEWIGGGGMGAVYRARHVGLGQPVALKLLRRERAHDVEAVQRLLREAKAAASIPSPHVVQVSDFGVSGEGQPFLVMELLDGVDLDRHLARKGRLSADETVGIVLDVLAGLEAAHAAGVVHRDLKAANVLLGKDVVKIADFGISKLVTDVALDTLTRTGMALGTPFAMAPEQARNAKDADARADLWAVGVLLYQCLSGRRPFEGASYEDLLVRICTEEPPSLAEVAPDVPEPLVPIVAKALHKDRVQRWSSAAELATALRGAMRAIDQAALPPDEREAEEEPPPPVTEGPGLRPSLVFVEARPRNAWRLPLALIGFVAAAGGLLWLALVLRPVAPSVAPVLAATDVVTPPADTFEVRWGEPPVAPSPPPTPVSPVLTPAAIAPPRALPDGISFSDLEVEGAVPSDAVLRRLPSALEAMTSFRRSEELSAACEADFGPSGRVVDDSVVGPNLCHRFFGGLALPEAATTTRIAIQLELEAR